MTKSVKWVMDSWAILHFGANQTNHLRAHLKISLNGLGPLKPNLEKFGLYGHKPIYKPIYFFFFYKLQHVIKKNYIN